MRDALKILEHPDGGFVEFNPASPNLYATYYSLKTLRLPCFERAIPHRTRTAEWLRELPEREFDVTTGDGDRLDAVYYGTKCLDLLDVSIDSSVESEIVETAERTAEDAASAVENGGAVDQYDLKSTHRLLSIYDALGVEFDPAAEFESWLTERWRTWDASDLPDVAADVSKTYRSLRMLGYGRDEILDRRDPRDEITAVVRDPANWTIGQEFDLLAVDGTRNLLADLELDVDLPPDVVRRMASSQNRDGGFSLLADPVSDCRGTYVTLGALADSGATDAIDETAALRFVLYNAVESGGFSLHYRQEPELDQTFAVHWLLSTAPDRVEVPADLGRSLPGDLYETDPLTPTKLYKILTVHERADETPPSVDVDAVVETYLQSVPSLNVPEQELLKGVYYSLLLDRDFASESQYRDSADETLADLLLETRNEDGSFGPGEPTPILETFHAVHSLQYLGYRPPERERLVDWVRAHRGEDGGFGERMESETPSDLVSTYFAVRTLSLLDAEVRDVESVRRWLREFRHVNGGWPRAPDHDDPRIRYTVLAADLQRRLDGRSNVADPAAVDG